MRPTIRFATVGLLVLCAACSGAPDMSNEVDEAAAATTKASSVQALGKAFASVSPQTAQLAIDFSEDATDEQIAFILGARTRRLQKPLEAFRTSELSAEIAAAFPNATEADRTKIHMLLLQIMMGDITGAMRSYVAVADKNLRTFSADLVKQLDKVSAARNAVIANFAKRHPPRAYAGQNAQQAARAQDKSSRYTQFVQMSTQLMNELQNTERELMDALASSQRDIESFWQAYASFRDQEFRTTDRIMTMR